MSYHSLLMTEREWWVIYMVLVVKEHSMNKAQSKKRVCGLQIAGCSMAVYKY